MEFAMSPADLRRICDVCYPLCGELRRYVTAGVHFRPIDDSGMLEAIGTDGRQMAIVSTNAIDGDAREFTLDLKALYAKRASLKRTDHSLSVRVVEGFGSVVFSWKGAKKDFAINCPMLEGKYPDVNAVLPKDEDRAGGAKIVLEDWNVEIEPTQGYLVQIKDGEMSMTYPEWNYSLKLQDVEGEIAMHINMDFLQGHLSRLQDTSAKLSFFGEHQPIRVESLQTVYVLMPMAVIQ